MQPKERFISWINKDLSSPKDQPCLALQPEAGCRFALKARISMEACGMEVFKLVSHYGWSIYPCGERVDPEKLAFTRLVGLALIC